MSVYDDLKSSAQKIIDIKNDRNINETATRVWLHPDDLSLTEIVDALDINDDNFQSKFIPFIWNHSKYNKMLHAVFNGDNEFVIAKLFQSYITYHEKSLDSPDKISQIFPKNFNFENVFEKTAFRELFFKAKEKSKPVNRKFFVIAVEHVPAFATEALKWQLKWPSFFAIKDKDNNVSNIKVSPNGAKEYVSWANSSLRAIEQFFSWVFQIQSPSRLIVKEFVERMSKVGEVSQVSEVNVVKPTIQTTSTTEQSIEKTISSKDLNVEEKVSKGNKGSKVKPATENTSATEQPKGKQESSDKPKRKRKKTRVLKLKSDAVAFTVDTSGSGDADLKTNEKTGVLPTTLSSTPAKVYTSVQSQVLSPNSAFFGSLPKPVDSPPPNYTQNKGQSKENIPVNQDGEAAAFRFEDLPPPDNQKGSDDLGGSSQSLKM